MKHRQTLVVLPLILISLACTNVKQPTARFTEMNVADITSQGFTMAFDLEVHNPNAVALPISAADYKVNIGGVKVADGKATPAGTIPANGSIPVKVPVTMTYENLLAAEKAIVAAQGSVPFKLDGNLKFSGGASNALTDIMGGLSVPLKYEGVLDVTELVRNPQALMSSPAAKKLAAQLAGSMFGR